MIQKKILSKYSKTYSNATLFFPKKIRNDIRILYAFVRTADNFVDSQVPDKKGYLKYKKEYETGISQNKIILDFIELKKRTKIKDEWVDTFFKSMQQDFTKKIYKNQKEVDEYCYGSAEVIGLMIARILDLPKESYVYAKALGNYMQRVNIIRDINEDIKYSRTYIPQDDLTKFGLSSLNKEYVIKNKKAFKLLIDKQIEYANEKYLIAKKGYKYIPKESLPAIKTAGDMYKHTLDKIQKNPLIIYKKKVKPSKTRVIVSALINKILTWKN